MDHSFESITADSGRLLNKILDRLTADYSSAYIVNFSEDSVNVFRQSEDISRRYPDPQHYSETLEAYISRDVLEEDRDMLRTVATPENIKKAMRTENSVAYRFRDISTGHVRWHHMRVRSLSEDNNEVLVAFADRHEKIIEELVRATVSNDLISSYYCNLHRDLITVVHKSDVYKPTGEHDVTVFSEMMKDKVYLMDEQYKEDWLEFSDIDNVRETLSRESRMEFIYSSHITGRQRWVKATFYPMVKKDGVPITVSLAYKNASKETIEVIKLNNESNRQKKKLEEDLSAIKGLASEFSLLAIVDVNDDTYTTYSESDNMPTEVRRLINDNDDFVYVYNQLFEKYFIADEISGVEDIVSKDTIIKALRRRKKMIRRVKLRNPDGTTNWHNLVIIKFDDVKEKPTRIAVGFVNIDEEMKLEEERRAALEEARKAQEASRLKTQFVQNISHDIRTPLNAIVGFSQLLGMPDGCLSEDEKEEFSGYISNSADLLTMLIDDVLNMSDIENNILKINKAECACNSICEKAISCSKMRVPAGVNLYYTSEFNDSYTINADSRRIQQILVNLLSNACKHTAAGEIHVHCSVTENPGYVTFSVTDTGTGVNEEIAKDLFRRFVTRDENEGGHGMGLDICKDLAVRMDGEIRLDTTYTGGARFLLLIPAREDQKLPEETLDSIRKGIVGEWKYSKDAYYVIGCSEPVFTASTPLIDDAVIREDNRYWSKKIYRDKNKAPKTIQGHYQILSDGRMKFDRLNDDGNLHSFRRLIHSVTEDELVFRVERKEYILSNGQDSSKGLPVFDYGLYYFQRVK